MARGSLVLILVSAFAALTGACATQEAAQTTSTMHETAQGDVEVTRFASGPRYSVNAYLVSAPGGLILIDAMRTRQDVAAVVEDISARRKSLAAILLTHTHPDHIGGLEAVRAAFPSAPIYASELTATDIRDDRTGMIASGRRFVPGFGANVPAPNRRVLDGEEFAVAGLRIVPVVLGQGEAESTTIYFFPDLAVLAASDVAGTASTPWLVEGHSRAWLAQVERLRTQFGEVALLLPGHGAAGPAKDILDYQAGYLAMFRALIEERVADGELSRSDRGEIAQAMQSSFPAADQVAPRPNLMDENISAIAAELQASR